MSVVPRFPVVLLWHMHQPHYRDALSGRYILPWTYLHAIKDYVDMAAHLEANPQARAVVNFTPVLLEQLEEIAARVAAHLQTGETLPDPVLALLADVPLPGDAQSRIALLRACMRADRQHLIGRYPAYLELAALAASLGTPERIAYASDQYLRDIGVWYHIAWLGETVKRSDSRVAALIDRERDFGAAHRRALLELIGELLGGLLLRYRRLAERGQCELAVSPYAHPILPLLLDFNVARESSPGAPLPRAAQYPGGAERAAWHMREALRVFERCFGTRPAGCWPSEGAISAATLALIDASGFRWAATSASVLRGCLAANGAGAEQHAPADDVAGTAQVSRAWQRAGQTLRCVFRHDELSDLIGFTYSKWHGDDAVAHFVAELERVARLEDGSSGRFALVALDGENAWEHYPFNGYYFLQGLYAALAKHPTLRLATMSEVIDAGVDTAPLPRVVAGSWVHGTLSTWIGDRDKNAGWDLLVEAKQAVDEIFAGGALDATRRALIEHQLALCESSDWFWWFGDYNPAESVRDFDQLYRHQLTNLYHLMGRKPPAALAHPISIGRGSPEGGGVMRRAHER
jgi:alpha-amylase/alpha-mannosidase (GH57 family)